MKVLWVSRHAPPTRAKEELRALVGEHSLVWHRDMVSDVGALLDSLQAQDRIVATLPLDLLDQLVTLAREQGRPPVLRPVMRHRDSYGGVRRWEFLGFEEVLEARVRAQKVGVWSETR